MASCAVFLDFPEMLKSINREIKAIHNTFWKGASHTIFTDNLSESSWVYIRLPHQELVNPVLNPVKDLWRLQVSLTIVLHQKKEINEVTFIIIIWHLGTKVLIRSQYFILTMFIFLCTFSEHITSHWSGGHSVSVKIMWLEKFCPKVFLWHLETRRQHFSNDYRMYVGGAVA